MRTDGARRWVVVVALVATAAACSSAPEPGIDAGPPTDLGEVADLRGSTDVTVEMADNVYEPRALQVAPGATVTFRNEGANVHNVTPNQEGAFAGVSLAPTESGSVTAPTAPGTYRYYCSLHASSTSGLQRGAFVVS